MTWSTKVLKLLFPSLPSGHHPLHTPICLMVCYTYTSTQRNLTRPLCESITKPLCSHQVSGATCFSKLDAKDSFCSIHLNEKSSHLTTFNTHHVRYHFLHRPFGLKISLDIFQMCMDQATDCHSGIIAIHDNICIYDHTPRSMTDTCSSS